MEQMRLKEYKYGVYIHLGRHRVTQESLKNQIRTLELILGHYPSAPLMPKFGTHLGRPINLDVLIGLR
jgi:hypothetical protein